MSSSTIDKAAINGTASAELSASVRQHGINQVREQAIYSLTGLAESALYEAERLIHEIHGTASQRLLDHDGSKGTGPLDTANIADVIGESLSCIDVAVVHLTRLSDDIRNGQDDQPF